MLTNIAGQNVIFNKESVTGAVLQDIVVEKIFLQEMDVMVLLEDLIIINSNKFMSELI